MFSLELEKDPLSEKTQQCAQEFYEELLAPICSVVSTVVHDFQNMSAEEKAQEITALVVQFITANGLGKLAGAASRGEMADLGALLGESGPIGAGQGTIAVSLPAAQGAAAGASTGLEIAVRTGATAAFSASRVPVPSHDRPQKQKSFETEFFAVTQKDAEEFQKLLLKYLRTPKILKEWGVEKINVKVDRVKHIIGGEIRSFKVGVSGKRFLGLHFCDLEELGKRGFIKIRNIEEHPISKVIRADIFIDGVWYNEKTFYPKNWDLRKLAKKIGESCKGDRIRKFTVEGDRFVIEGLTKEKVKIRNLIDKKEGLITSYPLWENL